MTKFKSKPVIVEATRWFKNGDHPLDYEQDHSGYTDATGTKEHRRENNWEGDVVWYCRYPHDEKPYIPCEICNRTQHAHGWINSPNRSEMVCPGDWIVTDAEGVHIPMKPDVFEALYEPVTEEST